MRNLLLLSCLCLTPAAVFASGGAPATADPLDAALAASAKIKTTAPGLKESLRTMPVEFAMVAKLAGYADEVGAVFYAREDVAGALAHKKAYWSAHAKALGRRLGELAGDDLTRNNHIQAHGDGRWRPNTFGESLAGARQSLLAQAERNAVVAALGRVEAVLSDIEADMKGADSGQALLDRKNALMERLSR